MSSRDGKLSQNLLLMNITLQLSLVKSDLCNQRMAIIEIKKAVSNHPRQSIYRKQENDRSTHTKVSSPKRPYSLLAVFESLPTLVIDTPEPLTCPHSPSSVVPSRLLTFLLSNCIPPPPSAEPLLLRASVLLVIAREALPSEALLVAQDPVVVFLDPSESEVR